MNEMQIAERFARIETLVESGFDEARKALAESERRLRGKMDDAVAHTERHTEQRHRENASRLDQINGRVGKAHEKADRLAGLVDAFSGEVRRVRENYHKLSRQVQAYLAPARIEGGGNSEDKAVTRMEMKWLLSLIVACLASGAGVAIWVMSVAGKVKP